MPGSGSRPSQSTSTPEPPRSCPFSLALRSFDQKSPACARCDFILSATLPPPMSRPRQTRTRATPSGRRITRTRTFSVPLRGPPSRHVPMTPDPARAICSDIDLRHPRTGQIERGTGRLVFSVSYCFRVFHVDPAIRAAGLTICGKRERNSQPKAPHGLPARRFVLPGWFAVMVSQLDLIHMADDRRRRAVNTPFLSPQPFLSPKFHLTRETFPTPPYAATPRYRRSMRLAAVRHVTAP